MYILNVDLMDEVSCTITEFMVKVVKLDGLLALSTLLLTPLKITVNDVIHP